MSRTEIQRISVACRQVDVDSRTRRGGKVCRGNTEKKHLIAVPSKKMIWPHIGQTIVLSVVLFLLINLLKTFKTRKEFIILLTAPLIIFTIGFALRLSTSKNLIDFGFFFTELSYILIYTIFTSCMLLGQVKYWKIR